MTMNVSRDLLFIFMLITPMLCSSSEVEPQLDPLLLSEEGVNPDDLDPLQLSEEGVNPDDLDLLQLNEAGDKAEVAQAIQLPYTGMTCTTDDYHGSWRSSKSCTSEVLDSDVTTWGDGKGVHFHSWAKIAVTPGTVLSSAEVYCWTGQTFDYDVQYSTDGSAWLTACSLKSTSSGKSACTSGFPSTSVSFLRIIKTGTCCGHNGDAWFRLNGVKLYGSSTQAHSAQQKPDYVYTAYGKKECPSGTAGIFDEAECKKAQVAEGKRWGGKRSWGNIQPGCFSHRNNHVWFNTNTKGRTHGAFSSVCVPTAGCPAGWPQIKEVEGEGTASSAITAESRADCAAKCAALSSCGSMKFNADSLACSFNTWAQSTTEETAEEGDTFTCKKVFAEQVYETACPSNMEYDVTEEKVCKDAGAALGKKWGLASSWNNIPGGCTISPGGIIHFNLDAGTASEGFLKVCSSSGTTISTVAPSNSSTTATTTPSLTSVCTPGVCTKGKWAYYLSGKTEEQCKATCEEGRKYVPVADGLQEDVYYFRQNGKWHDLTKRMSSVSRKVKNINYPGTGGHWKDPSGKDWSQRDHFYVRWSGYIEIKAAGKYTFNTRSDDGSRLNIEDKEVTNNGGWHAMRDKRGSVELSAGKHKFWTEMFEGGGGAGMIWKYSGPDTGNTEVIVPENVLSSSLTPSPIKEFNPEWKALGMCKAYSHDGDQCVIYTACDELSADKESVICEDNSFDWVEPSTLTTCKYTAYTAAS